MENEMPSLLLDVKICLIRLPPNPLQIFWQVKFSGRSFHVKGSSFEKGVYSGKFTQP
jgi:hypothetical protein